MKKSLVGLLVVGVASIAVMVLTRPEDSPILILVFFVLALLTFYFGFRLIAQLLGRSVAVRDTVLLSLAGTALLAMQTLGQLSFVDFVLVITVVHLLNWFMKRGEHEK